MFYNKFTGWVFIWFILYKLGYISYNPIITLYIITLITISFTIFLYIKNINFKIIVSYFISSILIMKIIPILLLKNEYSLKDIVFSIFLLTIFSLYIFIIKDTNIFDYYITLGKYVENQNLYDLNMELKCI